MSPAAARKADGRPEARAARLAKIEHQLVVGLGRIALLLRAPRKEGRPGRWRFSHRTGARFPLLLRRSGSDLHLSRRPPRGSAARANREELLRIIFRTPF